MNALTRGTFDNSPSAARRTRARALAAFFAAGASVSTLVVAASRLGTAPGWERLHVAALMGTVACALASAAYLYLRASHVGALTCHVLTATGTVLIGACQVLAGTGSPSTAYSHLYVWVVLHSAIFFGARVVLAHIVFAAAVHASALTWIGATAAVTPQLVLAVGTQVAAAVVVGSLASHLHALADTDPLTGLGNRRYAERRLTEAIDRTRLRPDGSLSVAVVDVTVDDERLEGAPGVPSDEVLARAAQAWRGQLRSADVLTRSGERTFTVIMEQVAPATAHLILRRLLRASPDGLVTAVGVSGFLRIDDANDLLRRAEASAREARQNGGGVVVDEVGVARRDRTTPGSHSRSGR